MQKVLLHDVSKCTGCRQCMAACSFRHHAVYDFHLAFCRIFEDELNGQLNGKFVGIFCSHCDTPICVASCPTGAITKNEETGVVLINPMTCIACGFCYTACPMGVPRYLEQQKIYGKCDLCDGDPNCVKVCSPGAVTFIPREAARKIVGKERLLEEG